MTNLTKIVTFKIEPEKHKMLAEKANEEKISTSEYIRNLIDWHLEDEISNQKYITKLSEAKKLIDDLEEIGFFKPEKE